MDSTTARVVLVTSKGVTMQPFHRYNTLKKLRKAVKDDIQGLPHKMEDDKGTVMVYSGEHARYKLTEESCPLVVRLPGEFSLLPPLVVVQINDEGEDIPLENAEEVMTYFESFLRDTRAHDFLNAYDLKAIM